MMGAYPIPGTPVAMHIPERDDFCGKKGGLETAQKQWHEQTAVRRTATCLTCLDDTPFRNKTKKISGRKLPHQ